MPQKIARRVQHLARAKRTSASKVLLELVEKGLESQQREKEYFFSLTRRLMESTDAREQERLKEELARITFGE